MAREIPTAVRAVAGLVATVLDETRRLPQTLPSLPVRALGAAMQVSLKLQQHWSGLVARGDEVLTGLRGEAEPGLATFDEDLEPPVAGLRDSAFDRAGGDTGTVDEVVVDEVVVDEVVVDTVAGLPDVIVADVPADEVATEDVITDEEVAALPDDPAADAVVAAVEDMASEVEAAEELLEELEGLDADTAVTADEGALETALLEVQEGTETAEDTGSTEPETATEPETPAEPETPTEVPAPPDPWGSPVGEEQPEPEPEVEARTETPAETPTETTAETTAETPAETPAEPRAEEPTAGQEAEATDEGGGTVAAATGVRTDVDQGDTSETDAAITEGAAVDAVGEQSAAPTDDPQGASELAGSQAAGAAPVEGYDAFSIAQLRGHLRRYDHDTVAALLAYEEGSRGRDPFLRMLRNRLERLEADANASAG